MVSVHEPPASPGWCTGCTAEYQVSLLILIDGNLEVKSLALAATVMATWRAPAL
jgi:hypothetical protein